MKYIVTINGTPALECNSRRDAERFFNSNLSTHRASEMDIIEINLALA